METITSLLISYGINRETAITYAQALCKDGFDTPTLLAQVTEQDLKECGITAKAHVRAILRGSDSSYVEQSTAVPPMSTFSSSNTISSSNSGGNPFALIVGEDERRNTNKTTSGGDGRGRGRTGDGGGFIPPFGTFSYQPFSSFGSNSNPYETSPPFSSPTRKPKSNSLNPVVFMEVSIGGKPSGRMEFELYADAVPKLQKIFVVMYWRKTW
jgi:hypothetical protein